MVSPWETGNGRRHRHGWRRGHGPRSTCYELQAQGACHLSEVPVGSECEVLCVVARGAIRRRLIEMGFVPGVRVKVKQKAPLGDPVIYRVSGTDVSMRNAESWSVLVKVLGKTDENSGTEE